MKRSAAIFAICALSTTAALAQSAITLGTAGSVVGSMGVNNATSGTITVTPPTGALGTPTLTWPATTGTLALGGTGAVVTSSPSTVAADFNVNCKLFTINGSSINIPIPAANTLQANGGCFFVNNPSANTYIITPNSGDTLNGGSAGVAKTFGPQTMTLVTTDGTNADFAAVLPSAGTPNVWTGQQSVSVTTLTISSATFTPTGATNNYKIALTSSCTTSTTNCTIANPSATPVAGTSGIIEVDQCTGGCSGKTLLWGSQYYAAGGSNTVQPDAAAASLNFISYYVADATHIIIQPSVLNAAH
jgi:hypothetical protein